MQGPRAVALILAVALLAGVVGGAIGTLIADDGDDGRAGTGATTSAGAQPGAGSAAERVYADAEGSVAFITAQVSDAPASPFGTAQSGGASTGSGFVLERDGTIVTNAHVIEGASQVEVTVGAGTARGAQVVGTDPSTDLALLRIRDTGSQSFRALALANSNDLVVGEPAYAIGNPFGLDRTLTTGVVSALQREITAPNGFSITGVIQTDAPINPGNSGGPLLDSAGEVIGVNSQIVSGSSSSEGNVGIGFAVPSNTVRSVVSQLERDGRVEHAYLGVQTTDTPDGAGAEVTAVTSGGPAAGAGIRAGDVVSELDGVRIEDASDLTAAVNAHQAGDQVELTIRRDGEERDVTVRLGEQPSAASTASGSATSPAPSP